MSFCKECLEKCKYRESDDSDSDTYTDTDSDVSDTSSEYYQDSSELPIDLTSLSISEEPIESEESSEELLRKRRRSSEDKLSDLLSSLFVSQNMKEPSTEDNLDILTSRLGSRLRISPKKKRRTSAMTGIELEDVPIKQRLRKSIKKPIYGSNVSKEVSREDWTSQSESY